MKMIPMTESMLNEMKEEAAIRKRVLERIPADKLSRKPHPKSMSPRGTRAAPGERARHPAQDPATRRT
jgi:hypothetical protein